ncbi:MAG: AMP-dependent synthetase/ligase [Bifidobacteriaceae bacterium]|jgi:long-chain acyl-CoA synthetase|nr:AMP-dependent synthetase/ligase [Bifidobacteriaceae bacterium]
MNLVNTFSILQDRVKRDPDGSLFEYFEAGAWKIVTAKQFYDQVIAVAKGLVAKGVKIGDSVAIISHTCYEWSLFDFAIWTAGAIPVPVYETDSAEQIKAIFEDANIKYAVIENEEIGLRCPDNVPKWFFDKHAVEILSALGESVSTAEIMERSTAKHDNDIATIVYTSGSTSRPKGVELTHKALCACVYNGCKGYSEILLAKNARLLMFLPLAHVLARYVELTGVAGTSTIGMSRSIKTLLDDLRHFKPTYVLVVPRILEKVYNASSHKASKGLKAKVFTQATTVAKQYSQIKANKQKPSLSLEIKHQIFDKLIYSKIRAVLGNNLDFCVSGGAPLDIDLIHFFTGAGIPVLEGYGMTETSAPVCMNKPNAPKIGTVGTALPGVKAKTSADGELLLKGVSINAKYHNLPDITKEANLNGWFHTGDLAQIDNDGYITITGRKKDIIVTAGGKNVSPQILEEGVRSRPIISQCVVLGDKKPFISALITLDPDELKLWLGENNLDSDMPMFEAVKNPAVLAEVQRAVDHINHLVSQAESIRKFVVLPEDFSEHNKLLTASQKVKRAKVIESHKDIIEEQIYSLK